MAARTRLQRATSADRPAWDAFVALRGEADVVQLWAWGDLISAEDGGRERPERILVRGADGSIRGIAQALLRRTAFGRAVLYVPHGPVWAREAPDGAEILESLIVGLRDLAHEDRGVVVKMDPRALWRPPVGPGAADPEAADPEATDAEAVASSFVDLGLRRAPLSLQAPTTRIIAVAGNEDQRIAGWAPEARNRWRRATREGTTTEVVRSADAPAFDAFVQLLGRTAARAGFRTRSPRFYRGLADALAPARGFHLAVAWWSGRPIAATFVASVGGRGFYLYGASDHDAPRHAYGSYAAMGAMLAALAADGASMLDVWGVAEPGDPSADPSWAGFSEFKLRFGGRPLRHPGTFDLVTDPLWYRLREWRERWLGGR